MEHRITLRRLLPALQQQPVPGADGERGNLRQRIGPCLEDNQQHADRRRDLVQNQAISKLRARKQPPDGLFLLGDGTDAVRELAQFRGLQNQSLEKRVCDLSLARGDVLSVRIENGLLVALNGVGDRIEDTGAL